ncbi:hypothetical protein GQ43DRAFT_437421 [Delitschia confertaspora ATCC 74209]|uniref:Uncharacterized protein n=1 Tax=Delitschia confertaspora ATCC 74209 TaxID=1513339 RepID=A0A9P4JTT3_9PLEO|nr:hypothetical protein GQ43DRAFT_437421 [Delitschia confertaspora ATCC 74209]
MSGLEVVGAVAAVVSAFHGGAELVAHIKNKHRKRKSEQAYQEKQLQESLETGETQVGQRFAADCKELGDIVKMGDAIACDRLLHIANVMHAEIIRSLQLAIKFENAVLNLTILHEAAITNRKDTIVALDELKQRILIIMPLDRTFATEDGNKQPYPFFAVPNLPSAALDAILDDYVPPAVTIPVPGPEDSKSGLTRFFAMKRNGSQSSTSTSASSQHRPPSAASTINFTPALNHSHLLQTGDTTAGPYVNPGPRASIMKDIDEIISSYQNLNLDGSNRNNLAFLQDPSKRDTLAFLHGPVNRDTIAFLQEEVSRRNTLEILNAGKSNRDTRVLNREALQLLKDLPPTPEEQPTSPQYPAFGRSLLEQMHPAFNYNLPQETHPAFRYTDEYGSSLHQPVDPRYSIAASSVYSDTVPPSLYCDSSSASGSPQSGPEVSPRAPNASMYPQPTQQPSRNDQSGLRAGRTRIRMVLQTPYLPPRSDSTVSPSVPPNDAQLANAHVRLVPSSSTTNSVPLGRSASAVSGVSSISSASSSSLPTIRTNTIRGPTPGREQMMSGRPCKDNNYWGFCKGAWTIREDFKKGMETYTIPGGMYNTIQKWQCKHCKFLGDIYHKQTPGKKKKEQIVNPNINISAVGIKYRWIFLAKCHVKKKTIVPPGQTSKEDTNYGCLICSVEGQVTGVYGNVETLMNHIFMEHARTMSERTLMQAKCILGREARPEEEWDINVPKIDPSQFTPL